MVPHAMHLNKNLGPSRRIIVVQWHYYNPVCIQRYQEFLFSLLTLKKTAQFVQLKKTENINLQIQKHGKQLKNMRQGEFSHLYLWKLTLTKRP